MPATGSATDVRPRRGGSWRAAQPPWASAAGPYPGRSVAAKAATRSTRAGGRGGDAGVGEHARRMAVDEEVGARDQRRRPGRGRRERRGRAGRSPGPRARSSRNGKGSGRRGCSIFTTRAPSATSTRPTSGAAHAVPSSTTDGARDRRAVDLGHRVGCGRRGAHGRGREHPRRRFGVDRVGGQGGEVGPRRCPAR